MSETNQEKIALLLQEIELQESNYKDLLRRHPEYNQLRAIRDNIRRLKTLIKDLQK